MQRFAVLPTGSHPKLLLPLDTAVTAKQGLHLYEPYSLTGKFLKKILGSVIDFSGLGLWTRGAVSIQSKTWVDLTALIRETTGEENPCFALLLGGTNECSKLTAQVMRPSGEILGYLKFSLSQDQTRRMQHESDILERLWGIIELRSHIPKVLHAGAWGDSYLLFLSPLIGSPGPTVITPAHEQMLLHLRNANSVELPGSAVLAEVAGNWEAVRNVISLDLLHLGTSVLQVCANTIGRVSVPCGVSHGDFAPWNTRIHADRLAAFDWESAAWAAPMCWDRFHFYIQIAVCLNRHQRKLSFGHPMEGSLLLLYLLNSIPQMLAKSAEKNLRYRTSLLKTQLSSPYRDQFWIA